MPHFTSRSRQELWTSRIGVSICALSLVAGCSSETPQGSTSETARSTLPPVPTSTAQEIGAPSESTRERAAAQEAAHPGSQLPSESAQKTADSLTVVDITPKLPAELKRSERIVVNVAYDLQSADKCRIYVRPTLSGRKAPGYGAHGSSTYDRGKGTVAGWFTMNRSGPIDGISVKMVDAVNGEELTTLSVPIKAAWKLDSIDSKQAAPGKEAQPPKPSPTAVTVGQPAPPIDAESVFGQQVTLEQYRGKVVLLDFWATWCGPCIAELPNVKQVFDKHGGNGFAILGVSLDSDRDRLVNFIRENDMPWQQVFDGQGWKNSVGVSYGVRSIPRMYLLDDLGVVRHENLRGAALQTAVDELVAERIARLREHIASDDVNLLSMAAFRIGQSKLEGAEEMLRPLTTKQPKLVMTRAAVGVSLLTDTVSQESQQLIRDATADPNADVSAAAFHILGTTSDDQLLPLASAAFESEDTAPVQQALSVRSAALQAVIDQGRPEGVKLLSQALSSDDVSLARTAVLGLGKINSDEATSILQKLADDRQHSLRITIACSLHNKDSSGTPARFAEFLKDEDNGFRREAVAALLGLNDIETTDLLLTALGDTDAGVQKLASTALSQSSDERAVAAVNEYLSGQLDEIFSGLASRDRGERSAASRRLQAAGPAIALPALKRLEELPASVLQIAAYGISGLKNADVVEPAAAKLQDAELSRSMRAACELLLSRFPEEARQAMNVLADSDAAIVRASGFNLLASVKDDSARERLTSGMDDDNIEARTAAAIGLAGGWKDEAAIPILKAAVESKDTGSRTRAVMAITSFPADTAVDLLIPLIESSDLSLARILQSALGRVRDARAVDGIIAITKQYPTTKASAFYPLYSQNSEAAVAALASFLNDDDANIAKLARTYLSRMRHPSAKEALRAGNAP